MKKQRFLSLSIAGLLLSSGTIVNAAPMVSIGDSVDVFFNGRFTTQFNDNVFNSATDEQDDIIFVFSPGLELQFNRNSAFQGYVKFTESFLRYDDFSDQDGELANFSTGVTYDSGPLSIKSDFSFRETQQNSRDVSGFTNNRLTEREIFNFNFDTEYEFTQKIWAEGRFMWKSTKYTNNAEFGNSFSGNDTYSLPLNLLYRYSPKLSVGLGYRPRYQQVYRNVNRDPQQRFDNFFSLALRGELMPKLNARVNFGYQDRYRYATSTTKAKHQGSLSVESTFDYELTPKINLTTSISRDFSAAGAGDSKEDTSIRIGGTYSISPLFSLTGDIMFEESDYANAISRKDETLIANLTFGYTMNSYLRFSTSLSYLDNDSSVATSTFDSTVLSFAASLRY